VQIYSYGLGLKLLDYPDLRLFNCSPDFLRRWGLIPGDRGLQVPVTHFVPAAAMGSGLGKNTVWRGDYDIQLFDPQLRRRYRLDTLRFGDLVAIDDGFQVVGIWITDKGLEFSCELGLVDLMLHKDKSLNHLYRL
jgi:hypothetical protein